MALDAGRLRHRLSFEEPVEFQDTSGDIVKTFSEVFKAWASVEPLSGKDFLAADANQNQIVARCVVRYREDLVPKMRFIFRNKIYIIEAVLPDADSGLEYLTLMCSTGAKNV